MTLTVTKSAEMEVLSADVGNVIKLGSKGRREFMCRFVKAGKILMANGEESDIELTEYALLDAWTANKFENLAVFIDHADWFASPSLKNLAGVTRRSKYDEEGKAVNGLIKFYSEAEPIVNLIGEILEDGEDAPDVGLSLVFWPIWEKREKFTDPRRIVGIKHIESIDLVFQPAADGRVLEALSASRQSITKVGGTNRMTLEAEVQTPEANPPESPSNEAEGWLQSLSSTAATMMIAQSDLPQVSKDKLNAGTYVTPAEVTEAIEAERNYLAALKENNVIQLGNTPPRSLDITMGITPIERIELALEAMMTGARPKDGVKPLSGIRELYYLLSGDYEMTGIFQPDRIQFANVTCATMAGLVANALNKRVVNEFQQYPRWWEPISSIEEFDNLQQVKWITLGGVGELPTVNEGAAYTELTWDDQTETADFIKKGGYLGLTLEAIDKDDTRKLRAAPRALAQAAWLTLSKAISNIFTYASGVGPTMSDSLALFHTTHGNLGTSGLSVATYNTARTAMRKQTEVNSAERLGALTAPKFVLVPPDLEITALQILASELDYTYALSNGTAAPANVSAEGDSFEARMRSARGRVIVVDLWTDTNNWAAVADPRLYPGIGVAFRYGRTPEIFSVASPTAGLMFTNDTMPVKARFFFATGPVDYRGLYKANVA